MRKITSHIPGAARLMLAGVALALVAGCSGGMGLPNRNKEVFDGQSYSSRVSKNDADPQQFTVSVKDAAGKGMTGARKAGEYAATRYCIANYGESGINWLRGPSNPDAMMAVDNGNLIMSGSCLGWR